MDYQSLTLIVCFSFVFFQYSLSAIFSLPTYEASHEFDKRGRRAQAPVVPPGPRHMNMNGNYPPPGNFGGPGIPPQGPPGRYPPYPPYPPAGYINAPGPPRGYGPPPGGPGGYNGFPNFPPHPSHLPQRPGGGPPRPLGRGGGRPRDHQPHQSRDRGEDRGSDRGGGGLNYG